MNQQSVTAIYPAISTREAHQLLGTLSSNSRDIHNAFHLRYRQTLEQLLQAGEAQRSSLESQLISLSAALACLLGSAPAADVPPDSGKNRTPAAVTPPPASPHSPRLPARHRADWPLATVALLFFCLLLSGGLLFNQLQQQIGSLQLTAERQQSLLLSQQQDWSEERQQWLQQLAGQQQLQLRQQEQLQDTYQQLLSLQQQLAGSDHQLALSRQQNRQQGQQIARLEQVSDHLISSLCGESASQSPPVSTDLRPAYLERCQQSWRLAAQ